ncbi:interferon-induced protein 44-like [Girardinichthys multiradiatus]|uniref:interferon-induced protein 44-like n=1 Tax=Girardinichthys multiradiatus TaxID=208333 RepID=UPI001FACF77A|nr:interferon-induced protein 44-like [Girardinichthys multiradiatus]
MGGILSSSPPPPPPPPPPPLLDKPRLQMEWGDRDNDLQFINNYTPKADGQQQFRILLQGPVGAGKSSFINSVISSLEGKICHKAVACNTGQSGFTKEFNPESSLSETDPFYNKTPNVNDKVHVLVSVIDADTVNLLSDKVEEIIQDIRDDATDLGIPHVAILTKIDKACPEIKKDVKNVFRSRLLQKNVQDFSKLVGIPENCIFPVKNYHSERNVDNDTDALVLNTLRRIIEIGDEFLKT